MELGAKVEDMRVTYTDYAGHSARRHGLWVPDLSRKGYGSIFWYKGPSWGPTVEHNVWEGNVRELTDAS